MNRPPLRDLGKYRGLFKRVPAWAWYLFAILYLVFPFDLVPDFLGPAGYLDDAFMTAISIYLALRKARDLT